MARAAIIFLLVVVSAQYSPAKAIPLEDRTLPYGCGDTVVVGDINNTGFNLIEDSDQGIATAMLNVQNTVMGNKISGTIPVTYIGHTYLREGREFMLVLRKKADGSFFIKTGQLMSVHPQLAAQCD